jgi:YD repeat-containing protein
VITSFNLGSFSAPAAFDPATNRISPNNGSSGWNYDPAGNLNRDISNATYAFDAEGRMTAACPNQSNPTLCTSQWATGQTVYTYDGNGKRVQKQAVDGTVTSYVYDAAGNLAAEYGGAPAGNGTQYLVTDALGSTRMVLSSTGCVTSRMDYLPYGYLIPSGSGSPRQGVMDTCGSGSSPTYWSGSR